MLVLSSDERAVNYWGTRVDQDILYLNKSGNAPIALRVRDLPPLTTVPIECIPFGDLAVPPTF